MSDDPDIDGSRRAVLEAAYEAVEHAGWVIRFREIEAGKRGQAICPDRMKEAAALAAAAEMLAILLRDGDQSTAEGKDPPFLVKKAAAAGRAAYRNIEPRKSAA